MTNFTFTELVDIDQVRSLLEAQYKITGILSAILDTNENILVAVGWQDICTRFHRFHPESCSRCHESDAHIKAHLNDFNGKYLDYRCKNGLTDVALPIIIEGEHVATLFTGQFFYADEQPDVEYFRAQAKQFGFDEGEYLAALSRVPIFTREQVHNFMEYYRNVVQVMVELGLRNLKLTREVAERENVEKALQSSRDYLNAIINTITDPIFVKDSEHRLVLVNDAECALAGRNRHEMIGKTDYHFFPIEEVDVFWEKDELVLETEMENLNEESITNGEGEKRVILTKKSLFKDTDENKYIVGIIRDITELKRTETQLLELNETLEQRVADRTSELSATNDLLLREIAERIETEKRLELMDFAVNVMNDGIFLCDENGGFRYVNEEACRSLGYTKDELLGMKVYDINPDLQMEQWPGLWQQLVENRSIRLETRHKNKGGRIFPVEIKSTYVEYGGRGYSMAAARDMTAHKQAEDELRRKKEQLEMLNQTLEKTVQVEVEKNREKDIILIQQNRQAALGEMLEHIAHQWKQPLNTISFIIHDLGETYASGDLTDDYISRTVDETASLVQHMAQTIDVFKDFYKPEKENVPFRLKEPIDAAMSFIAPAMRFYGISVDLDIDSSLSAVGHPREYAQVLLNILTNAKDAFKARQVESPKLRLSAHAEGDKAVVTIRDNAGGIPDDIIADIFDLYFTTKESSGGTGIGLYISKNIIEKNMGGSLSVVNAGDGAEFRIEIDLSPIAVTAVA